MRTRFAAVPRALLAGVALCACGIVSPQNGSDPHTRKPPPDIGTKMPDGTVYAGLSMKTGKPVYVAPAGTKNKDGTIYASVSPDTGKDLFLSPADAPGAYTWGDAMTYCKALTASGHRDWHVPTLGELAVQFINRADIGGYNETAKLKGSTGYYWTSEQVGDDQAWAQRFDDGLHEHFDKTESSLLRCVR
jgi:hypothetical protein